MPKQVAKRRVSSRTEPYDLRRATAPAPTSVPEMGTQLAAYIPVGQHTDMPYYHNHPHHYQSQNLLSMSDYLNPAPRSAMPTPAMPDASPMMPPQSHREASRPTTSHNHTNPWTPQEDEQLLQARVQGMGWAKIHELYFPDKSGNACRKRHERLLIRRRGSDWDEARMERLAKGYKAMRQEIWTPLARSIGERWEHVEKVCMQNGLKTLINKASSHARHVSHSSSGLGNPSEFDVEDYENFDFGGPDDSGVGLGVDIEPATRRRSRRMSAQLVLPSLDAMLQHNQYA